VPFIAKDIVSVIVTLTLDHDRQRAAVLFDHPQNLQAGASTEPFADLADELAADR
jgi:hypothetical protein